jgi:exocyst complex protein 7
MRGSWNQKGLEMYGKRVIDRAETIDSISAGREFGKWVDNLMIVAEVSVVRTILFDRY